MNAAPRAAATNALTQYVAHRRVFTSSLSWRLRARQFSECDIALPHAFHERILGIAFHKQPVLRERPRGVLPLGQSGVSFERPGSQVVERPTLGEPREISPRGIGLGGGLFDPGLHEYRPRREARLRKSFFERREAVDRRGVLAARLRERGGAVERERPRGVVLHRSLHLHRELEGVVGPCARRMLLGKIREHAHRFLVSACKEREPPEAVAAEERDGCIPAGGETLETGGGLVPVPRREENAHAKLRGFHRPAVVPPGNARKRFEGLRTPVQILEQHTRLEHRGPIEIRRAETAALHAVGEPEGLLEQFFARRTGVPRRFPFARGHHEHDAGREDRPAEPLEKHLHQIVIERREPRVLLRVVHSLHVYEERIDLVFAQGRLTLSEEMPPRVIVAPFIDEEDRLEHPEGAAPVVPRRNHRVDDGDKAILPF